MTRLVVFCLFLVGLVGIMNLSSYKSVKVDNSKFNLEEVEKAHAQHLKEKAQLAKQYAEAITPKVISDDVIVEEKPIVELTTPQLERAAGLYKQCISCHAKDGSGKKANKAPRIGGQMAWYIEKALNDMKSEIRINKNMATIVKKLSAQDMKDLGVYVSKMPWKVSE